ncbi:MAG: GUN4 N-terminal ARM-like repeat domain-containing protein [Microcystaceae cyanobacterium]
MTDPNPDISQLADRLASESEKNQLPLVSQLMSSGEAGWKVLQDYLQKNPSDKPSLVSGKIYQSLYALENEGVEDFLHQYYPDGVVSLTSERGIDYGLLKMALVQQEFELADNLTRDKLCELAGSGAVLRKWLYFTEVEQFPGLDLHTINALWWVYSEGKFGFSVQRKLWLSLGKDFVKLWPKIGWKEGNSWTQYPRGFNWTMAAPVGHLPLLNQLRGVRVAASLFAHPVWAERW